MLDDVFRRHVGQLAIGSPTTDRTRRNHADRIADRQAVDVFAHGLDHARRFVAESGRKYRLFVVKAGAEHRLRAIEADGLHRDADFTRCRMRNGDVLQFQDVRPAQLVNANDA